MDLIRKLHINQLNMKKVYAFFSVILFAIIALYVAPPAQSNISGAALNYSGVLPAGTCVNSGCHVGTAPNGGPGSISLVTNIPLTGYIGGQTYDVDVSIQSGGTNGDAYGFALSSVVNGTSTFIGVWAGLDAETQVKASGTFATHTTAGTASTGATKTYNLNWTAPSTGTGTVKFFYAGNSADGNGSNNGDHIYIGTQEIIEDQGLSLAEINSSSIKIFPNPSSDLIQIVDSENMMQGFQLFDLNGKEILSNSSHNHTYSLDVAKFSKGMYLIKIMYKNSTKTQKVLVE